MGCESEIVYDSARAPPVPRVLVRWDGVHLNQGLTWHWWHQALVRARCARGDQAACERVGEMRDLCNILAAMHEK